MRVRDARPQTNADVMLMYDREAEGDASSRRSSAAYELLSSSKLALEIAQPQVCCSPCWRMLTDADGCLNLLSRSRRRKAEQEQQCARVLVLLACC